MMKNKPHPVVNKLMHSVRNHRMWSPKVFLNKKKEQKKVGVVYNDR